MKIAYKHLVKNIIGNPSVEEISDHLFQLGHEHEIEKNIFNKIDVMYSSFIHEDSIFWGRKTKYLVKNLPFSVMEIFLIDK